MSVYDDRKTTPSNDELRALTGISPAEETAMEDRAKDDLATQEKSLFSPEGKFGEGSNVFGGGSLGAAKGLQGKLFGSRRRAGTTGGITGLVVGIIIFAIMSILPLKILHIVNNLEDRFFSTATSAMEKQVDRLVMSYLQKHVLPGLNGTCKSTRIDKDCVRKVQGNSPVSQLYNGWRDGKLEQKLATKHGIEFTREGSTYRLKAPGISGKGIDVSDFADERVNDLFDSKELKGRTEFRRAIKTELRVALKDETLWERTMVRYKVRALLSQKYGVPHCVFACGSRDKFSDWKADQKNKAFKAVLATRVVQPQTEVMRAVMDCILEPNCDPAARPTASSEPCDPGKNCALNGERQTKIQSNAQEKVLALMASNRDLTPEKMQALADGVAEKGVGAYIADDLVEKLLVSIGKEGSVQAGKTTVAAASKAIPIVGWIDLGARIIYFENKLGKNAPEYINSFVYASNSLAMVNTFATYRTYADEIKTGKVDASMVGSAIETLSPQSGDERSDQGGLGAEASPLYSQYLGNSTPTKTSLSDSFGLGTAYAESAAPKADYKCDDGKTLESDKLLCPEETLTYNNSALNAISKISTISSYLPSSVVAKFWVNTVGKAFDWVGGIVAWPLSVAIAAYDKTCGNVPAMQVAQSASYCAMKSGIEKIAPEIISWFTSLLPSPFTTNMSGARTFNLLAGGANITGNDFAKNSLGAQKISDSEARVIQNTHIAQQKEEFSRGSLLARVLDTDSQYSLVSQVALSMPSDPSSAINSSFASLMSNPFGKLVAGFGSLAPSLKAHADETIKDPFGVTQYGYPDNDPVFTEDPETYWEENKCDDPQTLADWRNNNMDSDGDMTKTNGCLLLEAAITSSGALFTDEVLPAGASTESTTENNPTETAGAEVDTSLIGKSTSNIACADGTKDLGVATSKYTGTYKKESGSLKIRLCQIQQIGGYGDNKKGVTVGGGAVVSSFVSGAWQELGKQAKADGSPLSASSSFRLNDSCGGTGDGSGCARPGQSLHQLGVAIDFSSTNVFGTSTTSCSGRGVDRASKTWLWLENNAAKFGFKQYSFESWHWDPLPEDNRCGGNG